MRSARNNFGETKLSNSTFNDWPDIFRNKIKCRWVSIQIMI